MSKFEQTAVVAEGIKTWNRTLAESKTEEIQPKIVITRFPFESALGGEEFHTMEIAKFYRSQGAKVSFWGSCKVLQELFENEGYDISKKWLSKPPVSLGRLIWFSLISPILFWKGLWDVMKLRSKYGSSLRLYMLSFTEKLIYSPWCFLLGVKSVWVEHARFGNWFHKNPWKVWYKYWASKPNVTLVTVSELMKKEMKVEGVEVIVNAIDGTRFKKIKDASSLPKNVRKAFAGRSMDVGFVGRLSEDKGIRLIAEAASGLPEVGFICCGKGELGRLLKLDNTYKVNWLDNKLIPCFMQNIDLLVLPATMTDPFGLVVLEAMHAGTPVLMTDKCGVAWHLEDEINAFVCKPEEFVERLGEIVENPDLIKKVTSNLAVGLEQFDYQTMLDRYWKVIV